MLSLPNADHTPLRHPPLPLVVAQARFAAPIAEISLDLTARFQAGLKESGFDFDQVKAVTSGDIVIGPGVTPSATSRVVGFQLSPADGTWIVTLMPGAVSLETPSFESFETQFGPLLGTVLALAAEAVAPVTLQRVGLRFVNVLRRPEGVDDEWSRWIRPSLVAPAFDDELKNGLLSQSLQLSFDVAPGVRSTVRTGDGQENGDDAFLLDIDTYSEPNSLWSDADVRGRFDALNEHGVALFQALVTAEMLTHLREGQDATAVEVVSK